MRAGTLLEFYCQMQLKLVVNLWARFKNVVVCVGDSRQLTCALVCLCGGDPFKSLLTVAYSAGFLFCFVFP